MALLDVGLIAEKAAQTTAQFVAVDPNDVGYLLLRRAFQAGHHEDANRAYQQALRLSTNIAQAQQRATQ